MNSDNANKLSGALDQLGAVYESAKSNVFALSVLEDEVNTREDLLNDLREIRDLAATTMRELYKDDDISNIFEPEPKDTRFLL